MNRTAAQIQQEIDMIRLAYRDRLDAEQEQPNPLCVFAVYFLSISLMAAIVAVIIHAMS